MHVTPSRPRVGVESGPDVNNRVTPEAKTPAIREDPLRVQDTFGSNPVRPAQATANVALTRFNSETQLDQRRARVDQAWAAVPVANAEVAPAGAPGSSVLGNLIGSGEGGYNSFNRGRAGDAGGAEIDFSRMTLGDVMARQSLPRSDPNRLFAVGKYQVIPSTMQGAVDALGLDLNQPFTPALQERIFADYLIDDKRPAVNAYITGRSNDLGAAQLALAQEFASVADPRTGRSYYDGLAGNSSSITAQQAADALNQMRAQYQANIDRGLAPQAAYDALRGATPGAPTPAPTAPNPDGAPATPLARGQRGPEVRALQDRLVQAGVMTAAQVATGPGIFGPRTEAAVQQFQRQVGLSPSGTYDRATQAALDAAVSGGANGIPRAGLARGQRGPEVQQLQDRLVQLGTMTAEQVATGPGIFGPRTEAAVQQFQRQAGLSPSGTFDNATQAAMRAVVGGVGRDRNPNPDVTGALQNRLVSLGYMTQAQVNTGPGIFGPRTEAALKRFQADNGVQQTGVLGPTTFQALQRAGGTGSTGSWPVPGFFAVNQADKPGEGDGEFGAFRSGGRSHKGIDILAPVGSRVESFAPGEVVFAGQMRGFGNTVIVQHDNGLQTVYAHLQDINVRRNQRVTEDTQLGTIGRSGNVPSAGDAHIHFEIREGANGILTGTPVDPRNYLQFPN